VPDPFYLPEVRPSLSQGDLIEELDIQEILGGEPNSSTHTVIVLSHDCEIDKPNNSIVLVARTREIGEIDSANQGNVRSGRVVNTMHLPAVDSMPESFVDFRFIHRVLKAELERGISENRRVASISDDAQAALQAFLHRFFSRAPTPASIEESPPPE